MLASVNPIAIPGLTVAGVFFVAFHVLAGAYLWRNRRRLFGPDERVDGDRRATRYLQVIAICVPFSILTGRLLIELFEMWTQ
jgi:uncharacterized iron-regulated membrane protein